MTFKKPHQYYILFKLSKFWTIVFLQLSLFNIKAMSNISTNKCSGLFSTNKLCSNCKSFSLQSTPDSWTLFSPRWERIQQVISKVVTGYGTGYMMTSLEFANSLDFAPLTQTQIRSYINVKSHHQIAFLILPKTAQLIDLNIASTYPDNPTRFVTFSEDQKWLVTNLPQLLELPAQNLVILSHKADAFTALHEVLHIKDFEAIYQYAKEKKLTYLLRLDVLTVLSELHAYQEQFRAISAEVPNSRASAADGLAIDLKNQIGVIFAKMSIEQRSELQKITGLIGQELEDYRNFLKNGPSFRSWSEILGMLNSDVFKENMQ